MVSPNLAKKKTQALTVSLSAKKLFQTVYRQQEKSKEEKVEAEEAKINVSELISKVAFFYEKIRNYVDYNEEHLYRKNAIARILKRQLVIEGAIARGNGQEISRHILIELIRAGYLPNNKIPETKIEEVANILNKYITLRELSLPRGFTGQMEKLMQKEKRELDDWILGIAASEIEGILEVDKIREVVIGNMYEYLVEHVKLPINFTAYEKDLPIQIYLSVYRTYMKFDSNMLSFILFKYYVSDWQSPSQENLEKIACNIISLRQVIEHQLAHPLLKQLDKITGRYSVFYSILNDMIVEDPVALYATIKNKPQNFSELVKKNFKKKFQKAKSLLWSAGFRSIIYIFLTKSVFAVLLEVPATKYFNEPLDKLSLLINILFPAVLLFIVILFTKVSSEENDKKVVKGVEEITLEESKRKDPIVLRQPGKKGGAVDFIFNLLYSLTFFVSFGVVVWILNKIHFTWVSIIIFLFFLVFVSFFSIRIRKNVRQLFVIDEKENLINFLLNFFFIPIAMVGKWLSNKFSKINIFMFFMDFVIETPFKVLVDIAEQWTRYVRERRDDID